MRPSPHRRHVASVLCLALVLVACADTVGSSDDEVVVVATTSILGDIASEVVADAGEVEVLIPLGVDAHDFAPSSQQTSLMATADLVVANGLGLEESMADVLDSARADGAAVLELAPLVDPIPFVELGDHEVGEHGDLDPHFWNDPIRVGRAALALAASLEEANPGGGWLARAEAFADQMGAADEAIETLVADIPEDSRRLVTNHESFGYFANRYGFELIGVVIPGGSTLAEPSSASLAELVEVMETEGVRVIFAETSQPSTLAEAVAAELGDDVQVVELFTESLGPPGSGAETIADMLLTNAERITTALG
jgi:zinc/manganese transport system substrate-binding protein